MLHQFCTLVLAVLELMMVFRKGMICSDSLSILVMVVGGT